MKIEHHTPNTQIFVTESNYDSLLEFAHVNEWKLEHHDIVVFDDDEFIFTDDDHDVFKIPADFDLDDKVILFTNVDCLYHLTYAGREYKYYALEY